MKKSLSVFIGMLIIISCTANNMFNKNIWKIPQDTTANLLLVAQYKTGESAFFKKVNEYPVSIFPYKNEIYLLNYTDNNLVVLNIDSKLTQINQPISNVIKHYAKTYFGVQQITVNEKYIFIAFLKAVLCLTKDGVIIGKMVIEDNINHFTMKDDKSVLIFTNDNIIEYNINGQKMNAYELENSAPGHFLDIANNIYVTETNVFYKYNWNQFKPKTTGAKTTIPLSTFSFSEPYLSCITSNYTIWFPYMTRDRIVLLDIKNNQLIKTVKLKKNFSPLKPDIEQEEGNPNFRIIANDQNQFYLIALKNKMLDIYILDGVGK